MVPISAPIKKLAILFADISGSTMLYEQLGDQVARQLIARCISIMTRAIAAHHGTLVKTIGDEVLCTFPTAEAALHAACEMQLAAQTDNQSSEHAMYLRIGFHYGGIICEDSDIYGDAVNVAARVTAITRASQIMTTSAVFEALPPVLHDKVRKILRTDIKGKQEQLDIFQVIWEFEDMGRTRIGMPAFRKPCVAGNELILNYRDLTCSINEQSSKLLLGRGDTCHIIVNSDFASRQHANVEFRYGNFILSDHSSNGTYIRDSDGVVTLLNREDAVLRGKGSISLGQPYADNLSDLIEFVINPRPDPDIKDA